MFIEKKIMLSDEDKCLLSKPLPERPCSVKCKLSDMANCTGCREYNEYRNTIKPYEENEILDFANQISNIRQKRIEIENLKKQEEKMILELPVELREFI